MTRLIPCVLLLLASCGTGAGAQPEILVAAASQLAGAMPELSDAFEERTGIGVVVTLGSSGQLAQQTLQGAPVDVFMSADAGWVDRLDSAGRLEPGTRAVYAYGALVLLAGRRSEPPGSVSELVDPAFLRIALANPEHAPYGVAARQVLASSGILAAVQPRLILSENARQAVQFAEARSVDVSIVARSLVDPARHRWTAVPADLHEPLAQTAAVIAGRPDAAAATDFVEFITGPTGREILARHGFVLP